MQSRKLICPQVQKKKKKYRKIIDVKKKKKKDVKAKKFLHKFSLPFCEMENLEIKN